MIRVTVKLRLNKGQRKELERWLWHLTGVYNWAVRTVELEAQHRLCPTLFDLKARTNGCGKKIGIPKDIIDCTITRAFGAWERCFKKQSRKPKLKSARNRLGSIDVKGRSIDVMAAGRVALPAFRGGLRYFRQPGLGLPDVLSGLPREALKGSRLIRRASGWYFSVVVDREPLGVPATAAGEVGVDLGFKSLAALSSGEIVPHAREVQAGAKRVAQAQRGKHMALTARLRERLANRVKDRNHKLSSRLVAENALIVVSKDNLTGMARSGWGRSVAGAAHHQLREMLAYKCRAGGRQYLEVPGFNSTRTCSACGALTGPRGRAGLKVRQWVCAACGAAHDRDVNAAVNTLKAGAGQAHGVLKPAKGRAATAQARTPRAAAIAEEKSAAAGCPCEPREDRP